MLLLRALRDVRKGKRKKEEKKIDKKWRAWGSILGLAQFVMCQMPSLLVLAQYQIALWRGLQNTTDRTLRRTKIGRYRLHRLKANELSIVILSRCAFMVF